MTNTIAQNLPVKLIMQLRSAFPIHENDPMLRAKISTEDGDVYYPISMYEEPDGRTRITCFDPTVEAAYRVVSASDLLDAEICPEFEPARLSQVDPDWIEYVENLEFDPWP